MSRALEGAKKCSHHPLCGCETDGALRPDCWPQSPPQKRVLRLPLKGEYFDAIKSGEKKEEYRRVTTYWFKRLQGQTYDEIMLTRGYPPAYHLTRRLVRPWRGCEQKFITHPLFGPDPVKVYAIKVNE